MNVINPDLLKSFRLPGLCQACGRICKMRCGHHCFSKGAGQVDHPFNLVAVGMNISDCKCHHDHHYSGRPSRHDFLRVVSKREGVPLEFIDSVIPAVIAVPPRLSRTQSADWLLSKFPLEVAEKAIEITQIMYREEMP